MNIKDFSIQNGILTPSVDTRLIYNTEPGILERFYWAEKSMMESGGNTLLPLKDIESYIPLLHLLGESTSIWIYGQDYGDISFGLANTRIFREKILGFLKIGGQITYKDSKDPLDSFIYGNNGTFSSNINKGFVSTTVREDFTNQFIEEGFVAKVLTKDKKEFFNQKLLSLFEENHI